jgi:DNA-directed RNA polymerase specialized sigma24 family protein/DNA-binding XRE family transcriptional regulator
MAHTALTPLLRQALLRGDADAWQRMRQLVMRCAAIGSAKAGAAHLAEDVAAEVLALMHQSFIHRLQDNSPIEPFLVEASRRVALAMRRQFDEHMHVDVTDEDSDNADTPEAQLEAPDEAVDARLDAQRAKERIRQATSAAFWRSSGARKYERKQYQSGDKRFAQALKAERRRRGWTQRQMAAAMGIGLATYISYEHACVMTPNPAVIDLLKKMQGESLD